jgi:hypothetical protein
MTQRTTVESFAGAVLSVAAELPVTYDGAGYADTGMDYTAVGEIESYGNHGVTAAIHEFTPVDTAIVTKLKGAKNYGNLTLVLGSVPSDAGQAILKAASESTSHYSFKLAYADGEIHYIDALVSKFEFQDGDVSATQKLSVELAICRAPVIVAAV